MFDKTSKPRVFGLSPGTDFPAAFVKGLIGRTSNLPAEYLSRVEIYVNTRRMQRRIRDIFDSGPACLLPKIRLITDLGHSVSLTDIPPEVPKLQRRLELAQLVDRLVSLQPELAPRAAVFDLADSLASLMDEMQSEGVSPEIIGQLDVSDQSGHWQRSLQFVRLIQTFFDDRDKPDAEARQRLVVEALTKKWLSNPPENPVIIAGSTGSRGATHMLMCAVASLPQGAVVLPGYDFDLPAHVWSEMDDALSAADHPQFRFRALQNSLDLTPDDIGKWTDTAPPDINRNRLVSLALRPAPVTDQWMSEGPKLEGLQSATENLALLEAPSSRVEALAIAFKLRECAETGKTAALVTPNRILTRQVTAALDRWKIEPDDSAGLPLAMSAPGRFLLHIAGLFGQVLTIEALLTLLKHPITHSGENRGPHLLVTRDLELHIRRYGPPFPSRESLLNWAKQSGDGARISWAEWVGDLLDGLENITSRSLSEHLDHNLKLAKALAAGPNGQCSGELWEKPAGRKAREQIEMLQQNAKYGGTLLPSDYVNLLRYVLDQAEVHDPVRPHPGIMIWGTLEARVQGADLVILGGLNEGIWPKIPEPDPWMNRPMRQRAGLLLPERQIGLSAHDFQQAICASEVWLTRSVRDDESETVPSRWLSRLTNLLNGLNQTGGHEALIEMRRKGKALLQNTALIERISEPDPPQKRPSPIPPATAQPDSLSVTGVTRLIRDPYAVYAEKILRIKPLDPLRQQPDAPIAGTVIHRILERFIKERTNLYGPLAKQQLMAITDEVLLSQAPWPAARRIWRAKVGRFADWFLEGEVLRSARTTEYMLEKRGEAKVGDLDFLLIAKADRLDLQDDGTVCIYDYKTGKPPGEKQQLHFEKQLMLTAAMVELGGFKALGRAPVSRAEYIGLGAKQEIVPAPIDQIPIKQVWAELETLLSYYLNGGKGYTSRRAMEKMHYDYGYDHLARFGEWDTSSEPMPEVLK